MSKPELSPIDRYYTAWAMVGEAIACILTSAAAKILGERLTTLSSGGWLPGIGDLQTISALTHRPVATLKDIAGDRVRLKFKVGRQTFYRIADFAQLKAEGDAE